MLSRFAPMPSTYIAQTHRLAIVIAVVLLSIASTLMAQTEGLGDTTSTPVAGVPHNYITGLNEIVNPANGSVSVRIPQPYPHERNPNWPIYAFTYDSNLQVTKTPSWQVQTGSQPTMVVNALGYGYQPFQPFSAAILNACIGNPGSCTNYQCTVYSNYIQVDPDGGRHSLGLQQSVPSVGGSTACSYFNVTAGQMLQGGDEHYKASLVGNSGGVVVWDSHGNLPQANPSGNNCVYASTLSALQEDVNGNYCNTTGRTSPLPAADSNQTEQLTFPPKLTFPVTIIPNSAGGSACVFSAITLASSTLPAVSSVSLPNGEQYQFTYDPTYQLLKTITYPTGATVTYTWNTIPNSEGVQYQPQYGGYAGVICALQYGWFAITKRVIAVNGVNTEEQDFQYTTTWPTTPSYKWVSKTTTVTTHDLVRNTQFRTVYSYSPMLPPQSSYPAWVDLGYMPVENTVKYYDTNNNLLKTATKVWGSVNQMTAECDTLPNGLTSGKFYKGYQTYTPSGWNSYGEGETTDLPTDVADYDYGTSDLTSSCALPSSTPTRETLTTYQSFSPTTNSLVPTWPSLLDRPSTVQVKGNGALMAETDYAYDQTSPACPTATPYGHDETRFGCSALAAPRGNATTVTKKCISGCTTNSVSTYAYDTTGQMVSATDANGNTTTYTFTPDCYTTDDGTPPGNTNAYICKITRPATNGVNHITKFQYGYEDGKLRSVTDANSQVTTYCYWTNGCSGTSFDPFVRFTGIQYPSPYNSGVNTFTYSDTGSMPSVTATKAITSGLSMTSRTTYDALGREIETALTTDPDGATYTASTYDGVGKPYQIYNPTRCSTPTSNCGEPTWGLSTYTYDALGRTTGVLEPDGSAVSTAYNSNCTTVVDETGKLRISCTDSFGRLTQVQEPGPGATASTAGSGTVTISGTEQTENGTPGTGAATVNQIQQCVWEGTSGSGSWVPPSGTVTVKVTGAGAKVGSSTASYGGSCNSSGTLTPNPTVSQIAANLAGGLTASGVEVTANSNGASIQITADTTGSGTNYPVSSSYTAAISGYNDSVTALPCRFRSMGL
jgi:YD repeat-containing protein